MLPDVTVKYSALNAYWLAQCAQLAYRDVEMQRRIACGVWGLSGFRTHEDADIYRQDWITTEFWYASNCEFGVLAYRGSDSPADWATNFEITPASAHAVVGSSGTTVHSGFAAEAGIALETIQHDPSKLLFITGHSKGAAQAICEAAVCRLRVKAPAVCYAFAAPRVFNRRAATVYDRLVPHTYRFVNNNDLVCRVPPSWLWQYKHVGQLRYFDRRGRLHSSITRAGIAVDRMLGRIMGGLMTDGRGDHDIGDYCALTSANL